jgi:hypothetical protein
LFEICIGFDLKMGATCAINTLLKGSFHCLIYIIWLVIIIALGMILLAELAGIDGTNTYFIVNILHKKRAPKCSYNKNISVIRCLFTNTK